VGGVGVRAFSLDQLSLSGSSYLSTGTYENPGEHLYDTDDRNYLMYDTKPPCLRYARRTEERNLCQSAVLVQGEKLRAIKHSGGSCAIAKIKLQMGAV